MNVVSVYKEIQEQQMNIVSYYIADSYINDFQTLTFRFTNS